MADIQSLAAENRRGKKERTNYSIKIHHDWKKMEPHYFASNFAKCWPIFKILSRTDLAVTF